MNNEFFGPDKTLDEQASDHVEFAIDAFAGEVDIKDTNIEDIDIYYPGDEYYGQFILPSLLEACGVSYQKGDGLCIATTTPGRAKFFEVIGENIADDILAAESNNEEEQDVAVTTGQGYCDYHVTPMLREQLTNPGPLFVLD